MLIIDDATYNLLTPKKESQLEEIVKEHSKKIFGYDSLYFDAKPSIASKSGVGAKPDGYLIGFSDSSWFVVEVELSKHPLHRHVISQLSTFMTSIKDSRKEIIDSLYSAIHEDPQKEVFVKKRLGSEDMHHLLSEIISKEPEIIIVIEEQSKELEEACRTLKVQTWIIEIKTYTRQGVGINEHAHLINHPKDWDMFDAFYDEAKKGFKCNFGDKKICKDYIYNAGEIVYHLKQEHYIDPNDQAIEGWNDYYKRKAMKYLERVDRKEK